MAGTQSQVYSQTQVKPTFVLEDGSGKRHTPKSAMGIEWGLGLKYGYAHGAGDAGPYAITVDNAEPSYKMDLEHDDFRALVALAGPEWVYARWTIQFTATRTGLDNFDVKIVGAALGADEKLGATSMVSVGAPCLDALHDGVSAFRKAAA